MSNNHAKIHFFPKIRKSFLEKINMGMTIKGMYRQDVYELPTDSIRELIANAVAHRSYLEPGNIQVAEVMEDKGEIHLTAEEHAAFVQCLRLLRFFIDDLDFLMCGCII